MMLLQKGREWKETREKFTNAFTSGKLRKMFPELNTYAEKLVKLIKNKGLTKINIQDCSLRYSTDTLLRSFVGIEAYSLEEDSDIYRRMVSAMTPSLESGVRGVGFFFWLHTLIESLKLCFPQRAALDFFAETFQHLVKIGKEGDTKISNLIDIVNSLKSNEGYMQKFTYGDRKAVGQPFMFFIAGENTLITTLTYMLYELAKHPEAQRKLRDEIMEAKGGDAEFSYEKIVGMKYMEMRY
ncbi:unnamed protein product [Callosobruchus maculatus]|uniref:Cytochrome P450 n=1 Tax=Callosobruchus maculatus TaxID=64391 RepID=A0A653CSR8_CALMS|nr:unnamed protein product [Callosobruchus maculatus]